MPVDSKEALERASLVRSDPSLDGVSRKNTSKVDGEYNWQFYSPRGEVVDDVRVKPKPKPTLVTGLTATALR